MDVVIYLTSILIIVVSLALVYLGYKYNFRITPAQHNRINKTTSPYTVLSEPDTPSVPLNPVSTDFAADVTQMTIDGFVCQHNPVESDLHVYSRIVQFGPVLGPIVVHNGGQLMQFGTCVATITVRPGGIAVVYGLVVGDLINDGGVLHVCGKVIGNVRQHAGTTKIHSVAQVASEMDQHHPASGEG